MLRWYEAKPKSDFEDAKCEKTISWIESLSEFGIMIRKEDSRLRLYLGADRAESHHVETLPDISSVVCDASALPDCRVTVLQLKHSYFYPLCTAVKSSKIYMQSSVLQDCVFGVVASRANPNTVKKQLNAFLAKIEDNKKKKHSSQKYLASPVKSKLEQDAFFAARIFFSYAGDATSSLLSSINFTNKLAEPNGLVPKNTIKLKTLLSTPPKMSWWNKRQPVLTIPELVSILALPPAMFGLDMRSGSDKTFSNIHSSDTMDPADYFSRLWEKDK